MEHGYYGRMDEVSEHNRKTKGVQNLMLDEHISILVNKHIARFTKEISEIVKKSHDDYVAIKLAVLDLKKDIIKIKKHLGMEMDPSKKKKSPKDKYISKK